MAAERPEWLGPKLAKVVEDIIWGLDALTASPVLGTDAAGRDIVKLAAMPKTAVVHAEGLAFVRRKKKGAILGVTKERVVLIKRTALPDGTLAWSAPVFLRAKSYSLGLTAGSFHMEICMAIMNDKGMHSVLRPHRDLGCNAAFLVDMNGNRVRPLNTSSSGAQSQVTIDKDGGMMAKYYLMQAGMVDLSCRGGSFGLDDQLNYAVYGPGFDAQLVLQSKLAPPPEFQPVYSRLNEFVKEGPLCAAPPAGACPAPAATARPLCAGRQPTRRAHEPAQQHAAQRQGAAQLGERRGAAGGAAARLVAQGGPLVLWTFRRQARALCRLTLGCACRVPTTFARDPLDPGPHCRHPHLLSLHPAHPWGTRHDARRLRSRAAALSPILPLRLIHPNPPFFTPGCASVLHLRFVTGN